MNVSYSCRLLIHTWEVKYVNIFERRMESYANAHIAVLAMFSWMDTVVSAISCGGMEQLQVRDRQQLR